MNHESKNKNLWSKVGGSKMSGLYRYEPSGMHFARVRVRGQLVRRKLDTTDVAVARRKLADFRRDLERTDATKGNTSFAAVLDDYSATLVGAQSTLEDKRVIIAKLNQTLFGCASLPLRNLRPSQIESWLSKRHAHKSASYYNSALSVIRAALDMAVRDRIITENPVAHIKHKKRATPIRLTPTFEQFNQTLQPHRFALRSIRTAVIQDSERYLTTFQNQSANSPCVLGFGCKPSATVPVPFQSRKTSTVAYFVLRWRRLKFFIIVLCCALKAVKALRNARSFLRE